MHKNIIPFQGRDQGAPIFFGVRIIISDIINIKIETPSNISVIFKVMSVIYVLINFYTSHTLLINSNDFINC
jgi:hypothetical protein